jgi:hypothetical protein
MGEMINISRFAVVAEVDRNLDFSPGPPGPPKQYQTDLAADIGTALGLPSVAKTVALEQCDPDEFVLWSGAWECFLARTAEWSDAQRTSRIHRLALLNSSASDTQEWIEEICPAFALPLEGRFAVERGQIGGYIQGRKDIVSLLELRSGPVNETEHYRIVYAAPTLTLLKLIATYLRKFWEVLGP